MNASTSFTLGFAVLMMTACSAGSGSPDGNNGGDGMDGKGERADGRIWVVGDSDAITKDKPAITSYDLGADNPIKTAVLPRAPEQVALTDKYAFVNCKGGLLVRVDRSSWAMDSVQVGKVLRNDDIRQFRLAAGDGAVWLAHASEGLVRIDPETLQEVKRLTFSAPTTLTVDDLVLVDGFPWILAGGQSFRMFKTDPETYMILSTIGLGRYPSDPSRVLNRTGNGALAVTGNRALVVDYRTTSFLRVDLTAGKVTEEWKSDWFTNYGQSPDEIRLFAHDGGYVVTRRNEKWVRTLGFEGSAHKELVFPHFSRAQGIRRKDGLFGAGYRAAYAGVGLFRPATVDTADRASFFRPAEDLVFED